MNIRGYDTWKMGLNLVTCYRCGHKYYESEGGCSYCDEFRNEDSADNNCETEDIDQEEQS